MRVTVAWREFPSFDVENPRSRFLVEIERNGRNSWREKWENGREEEREERERERALGGWDGLV